MWCRSNRMSATLRLLLPHCRLGGRCPLPQARVAKPCRGREIAKTARSFSNIRKPFPAITVIKQDRGRAFSPEAGIPVHLVTEDTLAGNLSLEIQQDQLNDIKRTGELACTTVYSSTRPNRSIIVNLGAEEKLTESKIRNATSGLVKHVRKLGLERINIKSLPSTLIPEKRFVQLISQTSILANYQFTKYKAHDGGTGGAATLDISIAVHDGDAEDLQLVASESGTTADETNFVRDLVNDSAEALTPQTFEAVAQQSALECGLSFDVLHHEQLLAEGLNMHVAVGKGAKHGPRLIILTYTGNPEKPDNIIALVGKGITFDTGGLNMKTATGMENMHMDMGGAAAVLGTIRAAARVGLKHNIVAALALAENAVDAESVKPHAIIRSLKGVTVEIANTDAEGRLVLGDAITYVQRRFHPHTCIDVATLTGACMIALGEHAAGLFSNDAKLSKQLKEAGEITFERCWPMPVFDEYTEEIKGDISDLRNIGKGPRGGACTAAAFLKAFVEPGVAWAHLDIAGPAWFSENRGCLSKRASGFGVQVLIEYLRRAL